MPYRNAVVKKIRQPFYAFVKKGLLSAQPIKIGDEFFPRLEFVATIHQTSTHEIVF